MKNNPYGMKWIYGKTKGIRWQLAVYIVLALCIPALQVLFSYFMKLFIDIATGNLALSLAYVAVRTVALVAVGGVLMMASAVLSKWIYGKMECNLRAEILGVIVSRRMIDLSKQHTGELLAKLTVDVQAVSGCLTGVIDNILGGGASALLATAVLLFLNWKIALILLVLTPLLLFVTGAFAPRMQALSEQDKENDAANRSVMQENLSRMMLIKTYGMQHKTVEALRRTYANKLKSGIQLGKWEGIALFAGTLFGNVMSMVTLGLGAYFVLKGETTVGSLIMIVQLLNYIVTPVSKLPVAMAQAGQAVASSTRIGAIYDLPADRTLSAAAPVHARQLNVKNVCFAYADAAHLLGDVTITCPKGSITGIVGKSGSGKSTLLKVLMGLYTPQAGTVELEHAAGVLAGEEILAQVAYVPPSDYLFSGSVSENIVMSEGKACPERLQAAASDANIGALVQSLPEGFDTPLGEGGGTVSDGQAQRIAIARAIYKQAEVIIFDEPTANLDVDSVEKFQSVVRHLAKDKICILVTHDLSTMTICDKIYELEDGSLRERRCG